MLPEGKGAEMKTVKLFLLGLLTGNTLGLLAVIIPEKAFDKLQFNASVGMVLCIITILVVLLTDKG